MSEVPPGDAFKMLRDTGLSDSPGGRHLTKVAWIKEQSRRVLAISRDGFERVMNEVLQEEDADE